MRDTVYVLGAGASYGDTLMIVEGASENAEVDDEQITEQETPSDGLER
jgi:hypothetical protein